MRQLKNFEQKTMPVTASFEFNLPELYYGSMLYEKLKDHLDEHKVEPLDISYEDCLALCKMFAEFHSAFQEIMSTTWCID